MSTLRILITNDDGVDSPGLEIMRELALAVTDDVTIVAPASNKSGVGHGISFGHELELDRRDRDVYAVEGTPADCVIAGYTHVMKDAPPDIVLSGVNNGQNLGDIINASGTLAGAREGAMQGALGIAMSQSVDYDRNHGVVWDCVRANGEAVLRALMDAPRAPGAYYNVNFPLGQGDETRPMAVVPHQRFAHSPFAHYPSRNADKFFIAIPSVPMPLESSHDYEVLRVDRKITVTPLQLAQTDHDLLQQLRDRLEEPGDPAAQNDTGQ